MIKYKRSLEVLLLSWIAFFMLLGASIFVAHKWGLIEFIIVFFIFEIPSFVAFPLGYQTIKIDDSKISLDLWFIKLRTFSWSEVCETGIAYTRGGYGTYKKFIYISKRPVTNKERFDILRVKDHKNFITMENRGNIIDDIKKYSKLPFRDLPTTEDFNNM
ncbi:hypothetical protein [Caproicibacter sp.]|uniref:hypothetical protein n=1 Tax=Caproicibacter sp. TaxID=2814884 RepID=UPI003989E4E1